MASRVILPAGYVKTGTRDGHVVCCLDKHFVRFTSGLTDKLGFVFVDGSLIPLAKFKAAKKAEKGKK